MRKYHTTEIRRISWKGQHMYNWSSRRTGESRGEAMFEMMLTERCLKVVQDEASSDYEAQQIRNKIGRKKKTTEMEISLYMHCNQASDHQRLRQKEEPGRKNGLPMKDEISTKTFSTAMITETRRQWTDISKLLWKKCHPLIAYPSEGNSKMRAQIRMFEDKLPLRPLTPTILIRETSKEHKRGRKMSEMPRIE